MNCSALQLSGRLKCSVLENGIVVRETDWQKNLLLDQGMANLATLAVAEIFEVAVKGTSSAATSEVITGTFTRAGSNPATTAGTVTSSGASRNFTQADIGALIKAVVGSDTYQCYITGYTSGTEVAVSRVYSSTDPNANFAATNFTLYRADRIGLVTEHNSRLSRWKLTKAAADATVTADAQTADLAIHATEDTRVTSASRTFNVDDIGAYISITAGTSWTAGNYYIIGVLSGSAYLSASPSAAGNGNLGTWTFGARGTNLVIDGSNQKKVTSATYTFTSSDVGRVVVVTAGAGFTVGTYVIQTISGAAAVVDVNVGTLGSTGGTWSMGVSGPFVAGDVGKRLYVPSEDQSYEITAYTDASTIEIDNDPDFDTTSESGCWVFAPISSTNSQAASRTNTYSTATDENGVTWSGTPPSTKTLKRTFLFPAETGSVPINEIGLSNSLNPGSNINIRVKLASTVSLTVGQQLLVSYEFSLYFASTSTTVGSGITGISGTAGAYAIEGAFCSGVSEEGDSDLETLVLEPSFTPTAALGPTSTALSPLDGSVERVVADSVECVASGYSDNKPEFYQDFVATFGPNDANAANHRSLSLIDGANNAAAFTYLFGTPQTKLSTHTLTYTFRKTWVRSI